MVSLTVFRKRPDTWITRTVTGLALIDIIEESDASASDKPVIGTRMMNNPQKSAKLATIFAEAPNVPSPNSPH